jgi:hypothetical protein
VQLLLPMKGPTWRFRMVDALIMTHGTPADGFKSFARIDRESSPLGQGFTLQANHWPFEAGRGAMAVSVDPFAQATLEPLWRAIEAAEDDAWKRLGIERPCDTPREAILGYPGQRRPDGRPSPNQPWYDGRDHTLVASPAPQPHAPRGTLLSWEDVRELLWTTCNPYAGLTLTSPRGERCALADCPAFESSAKAGERSLIVGKWTLPPAPPPTAPGETPAVDEAVARAGATLQPTPTLHRLMAAIVRKRAARDRTLVRLAELADPSSFSHVALAGGFAVVADAGAYVIDDWSPHVVPHDALAGEHRRAAEVVDLVERESVTIGRVSADIDSHLHGRGSARKERALLDTLTDLKLRLTRRRLETQSHAFDPDVLRFRAVLEERWGVADKVERFYEAVERTASALQTHSEMRTNRTVAFLTVYGFPIAVAASLFDFVFAGVGSEEGWIPGVNLTGVGLMVLLALVGTLLVQLSLKRREKAALSTGDAEAP